MTLCPMAIAVSCRKCPIFSLCPLRSVIGDYERQEEPESKSSKAGKTASKTKNKR